MCLARGFRYRLSWEPISTARGKPDQIAEDFLLPLGDVYLVVGYYLRHKEEVDAYMEDCRRRDEATRLELEAQGFTPSDWQERLRARSKSRTRD